MPVAIAWASSSFFVTWNKFSIGLRSGERGRIVNNVAHQFHLLLPCFSVMDCYPLQDIFVPFRG